MSGGVKTPEDGIMPKEGICFHLRQSNGPAATATTTTISNGMFMHAYATRHEVYWSIDVYKLVQRIYTYIGPLSSCIQEIPRSYCDRTCWRVLGTGSKSDADCLLLPWFQYPEIISWLGLGSVEFLQSICWIYYTTLFKVFQTKYTHTNTCLRKEFQNLSGSLRYPFPCHGRWLGLRAPSDHGDLSWRTPMPKRNEAASHRWIANSLVPQPYLPYLRKWLEKATAHTSYCTSYSQSSWFESCRREPRNTSSETVLWVLKLCRNYSSIL